MSPSVSTFAVLVLVLTGCTQPRAAPAVAPVPEPGEQAIGEVPFEPGPLPLIPGTPPVPDHERDASAVVPADSTSPTTGMVIDGSVLGHDPQVAASDKYLIVYTAHRYQLLDKATGKVLSAEPGDEIAPVSDFGTLFSPLWSPLDKHGRPNTQNVNLKLDYRPGDTTPCDPRDPRASRGCVREFYDTRIQYDPQRKRFWVESAVRNHLWTCLPPKDCSDPKYSATQARRFISIAVSVSEDPRKGFHRYMLVNEYSDWPKIAVADRYLILGHRSSPRVYVFDADALAAGNPQHQTLRLATLDVENYGVKYFDPVTQHGRSPGVVFLLGSNGSDQVKLLGLLDRGVGHAAPPVVVEGPSVEIGHKLGTLDNDAIWQGGLLYATWDECTGDRRGPRCGGERRVRVARIPATFSPASGAIASSTDPRQGFLTAAFGGAEPGDEPGAIDCAKPALDVNAAGDAVIVFARRGVESGLEPEVRYRILYHGEATLRPSVLVRRGTANGIPDIDDNGAAGIDLAFAQLDPDDRTVWVTHAYGDANARWFKQVVAAVVP